MYVTERKKKTILTFVSQRLYKTDVVLVSDRIALFLSLSLSGSGGSGICYLPTLCFSRQTHVFGEYTSRSSQSSFRSFITVYKQSLFILQLQCLGNILAFSAYSSDCCAFNCFTDYLFVRVKSVISGHASFQHDFCAV